MQTDILAGEEGFEPSHAGIKIQCLNQLGDSPTQVDGYSPPTVNFYAGAQPESGWTPKLLHTRVCIDAGTLSTCKG